MNTPLGAIHGSQQTIAKAVPMLRKALADDHPAALETKWETRSLRVLEPHCHLERRPARPSPAYSPTFSSMRITCATRSVAEPAIRLPELSCPTALEPPV